MVQRCRNLAFEEPGNLVIALNWRHVYFVTFRRLTRRWVAGKASALPVILAPTGFTRMMHHIGSVSSLGSPPRVTERVQDGIEMCVDGGILNGVQIIGAPALGRLLQQ